MGMSPTLSPSYPSSLSGGVRQVRRMSLEHEVKYEKEPFIVTMIGGVQRAMAVYKALPKAWSLDQQHQLGERNPECAHGSPEGPAKMQTLIPQVWVGPGSLYFSKFPR